uniref:MTAp n=1 Tax=Tetrahymena malaccensis TaxID=5901 RepID=A0A513X595_TETMA|nr:MTAp [Tetrahymena malaccensis]
MYVTTRVLFGFISCYVQTIFVPNGIMIQAPDQGLTYCQIQTNDEASILNQPKNQNYFNDKVNTVNQLAFWSKNLSKTFLPFPQNAFERNITLNFYDANMSFLGPSYIYSKVMIKKVLQNYIQDASNNKMIQITLQTYGQFQIIDKTNFYDFFQVKFYTNSILQSSPQNIFSLQADGQMINSYSSYTELFITQLIYVKKFNQSDFPDKFQNLQFTFSEQTFQSINIQILFGSTNIKVTDYNQYYSFVQLQNSNFSAVIRPSLAFSQIQNEIAFNITDIVLSQCLLQSILLPSGLQNQFMKSEPNFFVFNPTNNTYQNYGTNYLNGNASLQKSQGFQSTKGSNQIQMLISSFSDVVGQNSQLTLGFNCQNGIKTLKNLSISSNELQNANQTQVFILFNNSQAKSLSIQIQIPDIKVSNTNLFIQLPQGIDYQQKNQSSLSVQGFAFSSFQWDQNIVSFYSTNFSSSSIAVSIQQVQLQSSSNNIQNVTKIIAKCILNQAFVFYVDSNSNQTIQIIQPQPLPTTSIQINTFNQTQFTSFTSPENRASLQSQLAFSFSILNFQDTCSWLIVSLPSSFTIGFLQNSQFNLFDCFGNTYSYTQGNPISSQSTIGYTDNNHCIYISCKVLRSVSSSHAATSCLNNTVTIQNVRSPDFPLQTAGLQFLIANSNTSSQPSSDPPTFFNQSIDLTDSSLPYFFIGSEVFTHEGLNITQADLSSLSTQISSNYFGDVFNFSMTFAYPIYFWEQHQIDVQLPFRLVGKQGIECWPMYAVVCSVKGIGELQSQSQWTTFRIQFVNLTAPNTVITLQISYGALNKNIQLGQQLFLGISVNLQNRIINYQNKSIDAFNNLTVQSLVTLQKEQPLQISNPLIGMLGVNYTFNVQQFQIPQKVDQNYYLSLNIDSSFQLNSSQISFYQLTQSQNSSGTNNLIEHSIEFIYNSTNSFLIPIISLVPTYPFQLRISGLRNPSGIVEQNEQNVAQRYNFQLIWSTQQGNSLKNVWVIQSVSLPISSKYTCSPNCQACASNYAACTACAPGYLKSQLQQQQQYNDHAAVLACLPTCSPQYVAYNGTCLACQLKDPQCLSCSPSNLTQCSSCNQGYTLVPEFNGCVDSHLLQTPRSRLLDYSLSTNLPDNIDTHPDDDNDDEDDEEQEEDDDEADEEEEDEADADDDDDEEDEEEDAQKSDKAQSLTRMTQESSSAKADQREGGESSSNTGSKVMGQLRDTVGALKGGGAIFIWIVLAALAVSVSQSVLRYTYNKLKCKSPSNGRSSSGSSSNSSSTKNNNNKNNNIRRSSMRRSSSSRSSSGSSSGARNGSWKEHKGVSERAEELHGQRIDSLMLFLLSIAEAIQMPYTILWGFSVTGGDFESPVLQTLLGACALSTLLWIFDAYLLGSILANSENTPKTSCLLNPLPFSKRKGSLSFVIVPARLAFSLIPKSVSLTLTNIFAVEGWFRYPYGEDVGRATIVLTNFRKVLSSQIKSNVSGLCSLVSFLILQYPEVLTSYVQIYDLIIFDVVMAILCLTSIRNVDKLISILNQIQENEGELWTNAK